MFEYLGMDYSWGNIVKIVYNISKTVNKFRKNIILWKNKVQNVSVYKSLHTVNSYI